MGCRSPNPKTISTPLTNAGQGLRHRIGMAQKKQRSRLSPRPLCVIEPVLHQHQSNGSWYAIPQENGNHKRSSAPPLIRIQPKSARTLQCDGKWRSHFRRRTPARRRVETQRQWSGKAITRTTPILLGLYSLVCLWTQQALETNPMSYAAA